MGHSSQSPGKLGTPGWELTAKAPSLWEEGNKGNQWTRKLYTGGHLWNWRNGNRRFMVTPWRLIKGAEPDALKGASPVLNGGDEETGLVRPRLVATQRECGKSVCRWTYDNCRRLSLYRRPPPHSPHSGVHTIFLQIWTVTYYTHNFLGLSPPFLCV